MNKRGLTFLIANFNRKDCLKNLINNINVFNWSFPIEIVILDGGSEYDVIEYLKKINGFNNIRVIFQNKKIGLSRTLEQGLKFKSYKYFTWLNNDVEIKPLVFEKAYKLLENNDEIGVVHFRTKNNRNGDVFSAPSHANIGIPLLYGDFSIFRAKAVDKLKINHNLKQLKYLAEINQSILFNGYITVFTRDIGINHLALEDKERESTFNNEDVAKEKRYFRAKSKPLKNLFDSMYKTKMFKKLGKKKLRKIFSDFEKYHSFLNKLNFFEYKPHEDFILWQRYPDEFIQEWNKLKVIK